MAYTCERQAVIGTIDCQAVTTTEVFSDIIDMSKYVDVTGIALTGVAAANGTVIFRCVTCDSGGNNVVALKSCSTVAAGNGNNVQLVIGVLNNDLAGGTANTADRYIKFGLNSAGAGANMGAVVLGMVKYGPAADGDLSSVQEIEIDKD